MKVKVGYSPLASTSLGIDSQPEECIKISGGNHLVSLANRHFDEGNVDEACRLLREALQGVSTYLAETDKDVKKDTADLSGYAVKGLKPA